MKAEKKGKISSALIEKEVTNPHLRAESEDASHRNSWKLTLLYLIVSDCNEMLKDHTQTPKCVARLVK
jgi:hypothetical protein